MIANHYELSKRFQAILKSKPENVKQSEILRRGREYRKTRPAERYDPEQGMNGTAQKAQAYLEGTNFYDIASHLINYQSVDLGEKCLWKLCNICNPYTDLGRLVTCIGNNWMYHPTRPGKTEGDLITLEIRLWSWLFICDDGISLLSFLDE